MISTIAKVLYRGAQRLDDAGLTANYDHPLLYLVGAKLLRRGRIDENVLALRTRRIYPDGKMHLFAYCDLFCRFDFERTIQRLGRGKDLIAAALAMVQRYLHRAHHSFVRRPRSNCRAPHASLSGAYVFCAVKISSRSSLQTSLSFSISFALGRLVGGPNITSARSSHGSPHFKNLSACRS